MLIIGSLIIKWGKRTLRSKNVSSSNRRGKMRRKNVGTPCSLYLILLVLGISKPGILTHVGSTFEVLSPASQAMPFRYQCWVLWKQLACRSTWQQGNWSVRFRELDHAEAVCISANKGVLGVSVATKFDPHEACVRKAFQRGEWSRTIDSSSTQERRNLSKHTACCEKISIHYPDKHFLEQQPYPVGQTLPSL